MFPRSPRMFLTTAGACAALVACAASPAAAQDSRVRLDQLQLVTSDATGHSPVAVFATSATVKRLAHTADAKFPLVKTVQPLKAGIGDTLTIVGHNFVAGKGRDTVVFQKTGSAAIFVRATTATTTKITVVVPQKLLSFLTGAAKGTPAPTKFRLRVLAKRFALTFTSLGMSPIISGAPTSQAALATSCPVLAKNNPVADQDGDGMLNYLEIKYGTDPCNPDTDGDGITDGYEYYAALDLNGTAYPWPGAKPWPNPLDPSDANDDFDGDGLTMFQEFSLWKYVHGTYPLNVYSDGTQNTGGSQPVTSPQMATLDLDGDGDLEDSDRDADNDGLSNMVEFNMEGQQAWWAGVYTSEKVYNLRHFSDVDPMNPDTDGDGIPDGQDDQDNDGWNNFEEMQLERDRTGLRMQPFNPCLPDPYSLTCSRFVPLGGPSTAWPPFDGTEPLGAAMPFSWPAGTDAAMAGPGQGWNGHGGPQGPQP
jgi:Bacterial TSP3 repeat